jgi:hypothetical protein
MRKGVSAALKPHRLAGACAAVAALLLAAPAAGGERIVGGSPASAGEYPAHGYLAIDDGSGSFGGQCGGTLIARWQFLTAAHCVVDGADTALPPANFFVFMGDNDITAPNAAEGFFNVTAVDVHAGYDGFSHRNDLALLTLVRPAPFQPLRVIRTDEAAKWAPGTMARIIGWGTTSYGGTTSNVLLEADAPMRADSVCQSLDSYGPTFFADSMVCAGDGTTDTCQGDSGGPLMVPDGGLFVLVGVTSWGFGCADPDYPGVYARLGAPGLNQWVRERLPRAAFTAGPAHSGSPVTFTQTSFHAAAGGFTVFNWDFDNDGQYDDASGSTATRSFGTGGTFVVGLEATGPGSDRAVTQQAVNVNGIPTGEAGGPYGIREGASASASLVGTGTDPEAQPLAFAWDLDRNGSFEAAGPNQVLVPRLDGPSTTTAGLQVCDAAGACVTDQATIVVRNVAPRANAGPNRRTKRGRRLRFRVRISDPGPDRHRVVWNWGDRRRSTGRTATHAWRRRGLYVVRVTVTDDDGGRSTDTVRVRVIRR